MGVSNPGYVVYTIYDARTRQWNRARIGIEPGIRMNPGTGMNGGEARNGMVEQKLLSVMYNGLEGPHIFTDCCVCNLGPSCIA